MRAYALQDEGLDTVDANTTLGFDDDERDYGALRACCKTRLHADLSDDQQLRQLDGLSGLGIVIVDASRCRPINGTIAAT
jgi:GTP cyclohydrolase II